ncbi:glycosyltransferase family 2 protein [Arsenicitalea aurantiaca]|uniref:Glycosyltransferase family 2 protein n=1 Tax=Arsenicitalea aurantiaca TaxID=1783274 RepID=A0A433XKP9_9HYPH|nr:glycosyltransferase [Arsenicitalea aurantiaca]RUT34594.1 glycosyltransferase family 2 protein [Arsenicitalea aurantiaca]
MQSEPAIRVVVCLPTFRRPDHLALTLASLERQTAAFPFAVVVVDNDAERAEGAALTRDVLANGPLTGEALVEPRQGHCHAVNTVFGFARSRYPAAEHFVMLDDDEIAEPGWLASIVKTAERSGADLVGGPVLRVFEGAPVPPRRFQIHPVFLSLAGETGPVPVIYGSGNFLVRRRVFEGLDSADFDLLFNFMGGGDMEFFRRCRQAGFSFYWDSAAIVYETVPAARMQDRWLMRRSLHIGAINHTADLKHADGPLARAALLGKALAVLPLGLWRGAVALVRTREPLVASHPVLVAFGRFLAAFGFRPAAYKASPAPAASPAH